MKRPVFTALLLLHTLLCLPQEDLFSEQFIDAMESFQEEDGEQLDVENLYDILNELKVNKLDLNKATEEEFEQLPFLSPSDARNLVRHRELYGNYQTLYELKHIPDFTKEKIDQLLPFVVIRENEKRLTLQERLSQPHRVPSPRRLHPGGDPVQLHLHRLQPVHDPGPDG